MPQMDLPRIYRELKHTVKNVERYTLQLPTAGRSQEFPIVDGGRNIAGMRMIFQHNLTAAAAETHIANSVDSDIISLIEFLDDGGSIYQEYPNYGVAANAATKPLNRCALFFANDTDAVTDAAAPDFAGAGSDTLDYAVIVPICIPSGAKYTFRVTQNPITSIYAADVVLSSVNLTLEVLVTDDPVPMWAVKGKAIATIVGTNPLAQFFKEGETIVGWLWQLVTTTEAQVSNVRLKKSGASYLDAPFSTWASITDNRYTEITRLTGEVLLFHDALVWDTKTVFEYNLSAGAGTIRLLTFHPAGSAEASPDARNAQAAYKPPTPQSPSGITVPTQPAIAAQGAAAQAVAASPGSGPLASGPGSFAAIRALARAPR